MSEMTWIYHPVEGAKIVTMAEAKKLYGQGWYDTPAVQSPPEQNMEADAPKKRGRKPNAHR